METIDRIIQGSEELFMRYGVKSITMDDIASHLSISKKTIYQNFKDKDALVIAVTKIHMEQEMADMEKIVSESRDAIDEFFKITQYVKAALVKMNPSVLFDIKKYHPKAYLLFEEHKSECIMGTIKRNLEVGIEQGVYRKEIDPDALAKMRSWQIELPFDPSIFPSKDYNMLDVSIQFLDHFVMGLITQKGLEILENYRKQYENQ